MSGHVPVMLAEVIEALAPKDGGRYIDGTFGGGGYARAILDAADCTVLGIDRDPEAVARGRDITTRYDGRLVVALGSFADLDDLFAEERGGHSDGVVLDLGVSSFQLGEPERGFSFRDDGPLDMRMSKQGPSAADVVNTADEKTLTRIIATLGEERHARRVARAIIAARPLSRTKELADIVSKALGPAALREPIHPATRTFQALRIHVNDELGELQRGLEAAERVLKTGGRLAVVAFHSLEDRIVKRFLVDQAKTVHASRHAPEASRAAPIYRLVGSRAVVPGEAEIAANPRARSAKLRAAERLAA